MSVEWCCWCCWSRPYRRCRRGDGWIGGRATVQVAGRDFTPGHHRGGTWSLMAKGCTTGLGARAMYEPGASRTIRMASSVSSHPSGEGPTQPARSEKLPAARGAGRHVGADRVAHTRAVRRLPDVRAPHDRMERGRQPRAPFLLPGCSSMNPHPSSPVILVVKSLTLPGKHLEGFVPGVRSLHG